MITLHTIDCIVDVEEVESLTYNNINVFPNPTNDFVNLDLKLDKKADEVNVQIMDTMGKIISSGTFNNIQNEVIPFDICDFVNGTYFMTVHSPEGTSSQKFTIIN